MTTASEQYEQLVKELHQALLANDGVENIQVRHNVKIIGKSGASHQIDVYWEFRLAGVTYKTCIECKHYNTNVKKSHIAAFSAVLEDIGNATGIFATTVGFQEGAILFAKEKGIRLILVNHLIKTISITSNFIIPVLQIRNINYNKAQASSRLSERGLTSPFALRRCWDQSTEFYNQSGEVVTTYKDLFNGRLNKEGEFTIPTKGIYDLTEIGLIEMESIDYRVDIHKDQQISEITSDFIEKAIMEDVLENHSCYLNDDGTITKFSSENQ